MIALFPVRPPRCLASMVLQATPVHPTLINVMVTTPHLSVPAKALIDSGAAVNFISQSFLNTLQMCRKVNSQHLRINNILRQPMGGDRVCFHSPIFLLIGESHQEVIAFWALEGSTSDIILGRPWLKLHQPYIDWTMSKVIHWGKDCQSRCLHGPVSTSPHPSSCPGKALISFRRQPVSKFY